MAYYVAYGFYMEPYGVIWDHMKSIMLHMEFIRTRGRGARSGLFRSWAGVCVAGRRTRLGAGPAGVVPCCRCVALPSWGGGVFGGVGFGGRGAHGSLDLVEIYEMSLWTYV